MDQEFGSGRLDEFSGRVEISQIELDEVFATSTMKEDWP